MSQKGASRRSPPAPHNKWQIDFTGRSSRSLGAAAIGDKHISPWTQVLLSLEVVPHTIRDGGAITTITRLALLGCFYHLGFSFSVEFFASVRYLVFSVILTNFHYSSRRTWRHHLDTALISWLWTLLPRTRMENWLSKKPGTLLWRLSNRCVNCVSSSNVGNRVQLSINNGRHKQLPSQVPMNMFIMWMSGNSISIFPIMMVGMMFLRPIQALFSAGQAFKAIEGDQAPLQKLVWLLGEFVSCGSFPE